MTCSTAMPMSTPPTTPINRTIETLSALYGASRSATSGTITAKIGGCCAPSQTHTCQATTDATTMRSMLGPSAARIGRARAS